MSTSHKNYSQINIHKVTLCSWYCIVDFTTLLFSIQVKEEADDDIIVEYCDINPSQSNNMKSGNIFETIILQYEHQEVVKIIFFLQKN